MFCSKSDNTRINDLHKRTLRCVYNSPQESLDKLLTVNGKFDIHTINLQTLLLFMFKIVHNDCPEIAKDFFSTKDISYNLRSNSVINLPKCNTKTYGINTVFFKGGIVWNGLPNDIKNSLNYLDFAKKIKKLKPKCSCKICTS